MAEEEELGYLEAVQKLREIGDSEMIIGDIL